MSNPRIGTRVKRVRDGATGIVVRYIDFDPRCMGVRVDQGGVGYAEGGQAVHYAPGTTVYSLPFDWSPILPSGAAPSEHTFHQLMDLLTAGEVAPV